MSYTETESVRWKEFANAKLAHALSQNGYEKQWSNNLKNDIIFFMLVKTFLELTLYKVFKCLNHILQYNHLRYIIIFKK